MLLFTSPAEELTDNFGKKLNKLATMKPDLTALPVLKAKNTGYICAQTLHLQDYVACIRAQKFLKQNPNLLLRTHFLSLKLKSLNLFSVF